jgi:Ser/Thr protein kinase RdoA (MazF antagonist)
MKNFEDLSRRGQRQRLRKLAWNALAQYDLQVESLRLAGWYTNVMFRVRSQDGQLYMLRICPPGWRTETDLRSEITWLNALAQETDIGAPRPIATREGEYLPQVGANGVMALFCMLMTWVPGVLLGKHLSEENMVKMGKLFARMHAHGEQYSPPDGFTTRRMDCVLARQEDDVLFTPEHAAAFTGESREIFEQVRQRVEDAYAQRYNTQQPIVIHHDLWHDNIHLYRGQLFPLDFEDTVWGFPVQDIAMAMQDLMTDVAPDRYEPLLAAFRHGYEEMRPWPEAYEGEMDIFRAGRMLWVANYIADDETEHLPGAIADMAPMLAEFLETGKLRKK